MNNCAKLDYLFLELPVVFTFDSIINIQVILGGSYCGLDELDRSSPFQEMAPLEYVSLPNLATSY